MKKILVTGANGFLGQQLCVHLQNAGFTVIATGRGESRIPPHFNITYHAADLANKQEIKYLLQQHTPYVIIHNAAISKPDECENNKEACLKANVESTRYLLESNCNHFIYISTDFIFGENGPHAEDATPGPLNFYGESKLQSEELVKSSGLNYTIVRPVFIYGPVWEGLRGSFLHWVQNNLQQQKPLRIVSDQQRTPTYVIDICKGIEVIIKNQATGVYNLAGKDIVSPYDMAMQTASILDLDAGLVEKTTADTFPEPVRRAKQSGLTIAKAEKDLNYKPVSFAEGIRLTFNL